MEALRSPMLNDVQVRLFKDRSNQNKSWWSREVLDNKEDWIMPIFKKNKEDPAPLESPEQ